MAEVDRKGQGLGRREEGDITDQRSRVVRTEQEIMEGRERDLRLASGESSTTPQIRPCRGKIRNRLDLEFCYMKHCICR